MQVLLLVSAVLFALGLSLLWWGRFPLLAVVVRAVLRMGVQLGLVGLVLGAIFRWQSPLVTILYLIFMTVAATYIACERQTIRYPAMFAHAGLALTVAVWSSTGLALLMLEGPSEILNPRHVIPLFGICCGNMLNGFTIGYREFLELHTNQRAEVETRLSLGASPWEAMWPHLCTALEKALLPITNAMLAAGIVSLPGALVGQLAAGTDPLAASLYQILVLATIFAATCIGSLLVLLLNYRRLARQYAL